MRTTYVDTFPYIPKLAAEFNLSRIIPYTAVSRVESLSLMNHGSEHEMGSWGLRSMLS